MRTIIVSPSCTADSALDLANRLNVDYIRSDKDDPYTFNDEANIINWGCSRIKGGNVILNNPRAVRRSLNKLRTFELLSDKVRMPTMTLDTQQASQWASDGRKVVVRSLIKGCKSKGITITRDPTEVTTLPAKFYTRFIANCTEYRINVYKGKVVTVYRKEPSNGDFRFKIQLGDVIEATYTETLKEFIKAVDENIKLDMYGLDMLYTPKGKWFLLEVNSAPILFPITFKRLAKLIKQEYLQNG